MMVEATLKDVPRAIAKTSLAEQITAANDFPFCAEFVLPRIGATLTWLRQQTQRPRLFWSSRGDSASIAGVGSAILFQGHEEESPADVLARCREAIAGHPTLKVFGGFAFCRESANDSVSWSAFGSSKFWIPRITFDGRRLNVVVLNESDRSQALAAVDEIVWDEPTGPDQVPRCVGRVDIPDQVAWNHSVDKALRLFDEEVLEKVVLARKASFEFAEPICPIGLTDRLSQATHACYHFCFQLEDDTAFVGATPERLFRRQGRDLLSEVVAGTRRRGRDESEDLALEAELLASGKDQLEHDIVRKSIRQRLHADVTALRVDAKASILKLAKKQHLFSNVVGSLKPKVSDGRLIERLHPTPAVGGYPTENALAEIQRLESFHRGWYAGPIGWVGADAAEFAVAIRSGLVRDRQLSLYSGAGIVPGSTAESEWEEIEHKIGDFLEIIQNAD